MTNKRFQSKIIQNINSKSMFFVKNFDEKLLFIHQNIFQQ
jgi:hypothetical protein